MTAPGPRRIPFGRLVGTHGVRGELRLRPHNAGSRGLEHLERLWIDGLGDEPAKVLSRRRHHDVWLVRLDVASSPEAAKELAGREVLVDERDLEPPGEGEYYHYQLVGLDVADEAGERIGRVREVLATAGSDLLVIDAPLGEYLVPIVDEFVREVDLTAGRIVIRPIPGMLEPAE